MKLITILIFAVPLFGACSTVARVNEVLDQTKKIAGQVSEYVDKGKDLVAKADTNQDGKIDWDDLWTVLGVGGGGLLTVGGVAAAKLNGARKERTDELYDEKVKIKERLAAIEAKNG